MKDKCVLITGSSRGIGLSITQKLLELGAKVIGIARDHENTKIDNDNYSNQKKTYITFIT